VFEMKIKRDKKLKKQIKRIENKLNLSIVQTRPFCFTKYAIADMIVVSQKIGKCSTWDMFTVCGIPKNRKVFDLGYVYSICKKSGLKIVGFYWSNLQF
jgi:hypothetical protein